MPFVLFMALLITGCELSDVESQAGNCRIGTHLTIGELHRYYETSTSIRSWNILTLEGKAYRDCGMAEEFLDLVIDPTGGVSICEGDTCSGGFFYDLDPNDQHYWNEGPFAVDAEPEPKGE